MASQTMLGLHIVEIIAVVIESTHSEIMAESAATDMVSTTTTTEMDQTGVCDIPYMLCNTKCL